MIGSGRSYHRVFSGPVVEHGRISHIIGLHGINPEGQCDVDVIAADAQSPLVTLTATPTADSRSIQISPAAPEAILYLDHLNPDNGLGALQYADLSVASPKAMPVPLGAKVLEEGIHFGATGRQMLFLAQYKQEQLGGQLYWWDGVQPPKLLGAKAPFRALLFSEDRHWALAGINLDKSTSMGDLVLIETATGAVRPVAQGVALLPAAHKAEQAILEFSTELAFSFTANGQHAAFTTKDGTVFQCVAEELKAEVGEKGMFPSVSEDGHSIAYYSGGQLVVRSHGKTTTLPAKGAFCPRWSPDGRFVAFLTQFKMEGMHPVFGSVVGADSVLPVGKLQAIAWPDGAAWRSAHFWPSHGATKQFSLLAHLHDLTKVATLDGAVGGVFVGDPVHILPPSRSRN